MAKGGLPDKIDEALLNAGDRAGIRIANAMKDAGLAPSTSEANRLIRSGAVFIGEVDLPDDAMKDEKFELGKGKRYLVRVGSKNRQFRRITVE